MSKVFDGGVGSCNGGMFERSIESADRDLEDRRDESAEQSEDIMRRICYEAGSRKISCSGSNVLR